MQTWRKKLRKVSVMEEKVEDKKKIGRKGTEKTQNNTLLKGKMCYSIVTWCSTTKSEMLSFWHSGMYTQNILPWRFRFQNFYSNKSGTESVLKSNALISEYSIYTNNTTARNIKELYPVFILHINGHKHHAAGNSASNTAYHYLTVLQRLWHMLLATDIRARSHSRSCEISMEKVAE